MRVSEATYIRNVLKKLEPERLSPCVNLGSSTAQFRKEINSCIHTEIVAPLESGGVRFIHADLKSGDGVDLVGDIFDEATQSALRSVNIGLLLCCNMMEHVANPQVLAEILDSVLPEDAFLLVSVPYSFPLHLDPIDTYFRPTPETVLAMFPNFDHVESAIVNSTSYLDDIRTDPDPRSEGLKLLKKILTIPYPFFGLEKWTLRHHRLLWLFRRYKITCILMQKKTVKRQTQNDRRDPGVCRFRVF